MISSVLATALAASLVPQALASLYLTAPVASTSCAAGAPCAVTWNDDGTTPALGTIGACTVGLYVGSQQTQIKLQDLGSVDIASQATASFVPDATIGGNSNLYFIRFTAENYQDPTTGFPFEGFSAKFTLTGMTGTFNQTESSLMFAATSNIGGTTAAGSTTTAASVATTSKASTSGVVSSTTKASGSSTSTTKSTSSPATSSGAASPAAFVSSSAITGVVAVVASAFLAAVAL